MDKKIILEFTQSEIDVIFDCLIGSRSLDASYADLVNYVHEFATGTDFYCSDHEKEKENKDELP